jgi:pyruvate dehydrogenase E1 component alpha subunit
MKIERVSDRAAAYGMTGVTIDGNDVLAVKEAAREAITRVKSGGGQTLLECITWRHHQHFMGDDVVYKDPAEQARWLSPEMDPISRFEARILADGAATSDEIAEIKARIEEDVREAFEYGQTSPDPDPASFRDNVYKE